MWAVGAAAQLVCAATMQAPLHWAGHRVVATAERRLGAQPCRAGRAGQGHNRRGLGEDVRAGSKQLAASKAKPASQQPEASAMDLSMKNKTRHRSRVLKTYKRRVRRHTNPMISEDVIFDILVRLPAQDLIRFKSVCKAWRAIISDPFFIRMHLQQSTHKQQQGPSFLISPHTVDKVYGEFWPTTFSNNISFYLWQEGQKDVNLVRSMDFHGEFGTVYPMSHCDGLVLIPTDTKVYVLNPAIGDVLKLPDGHKDVAGSQSVGLGLDPRSGKYKVVHSFYRSKDMSKRVYDSGMEVFTIGGDDLDMCWRSTVNDPPYPVLPQGDPKCVKGSIYWELYKRLLESPPQGFLKFSLEDETLSLIHYPSMLSEKDRAHLIELGGELCLAQILAATEQIVIWRSLSSPDGHHWTKIYAINLFGAETFQPLLGTCTDGILVRSGNYLYRCDELSRFAREVLCMHQATFKNARAGSFRYGFEDVFYYNIIPFVESLVRVTTGKLPVVSE